MKSRSPCIPLRTNYFLSETCCFSVVISRLKFCSYTLLILVAGHTVTDDITKSELVIRSLTVRPAQHIILSLSCGSRCKSTECFFYSPTQQRGLVSEWGVNTRSADAPTSAPKWCHNSSYLLPTAFGFPFVCTFMPLLSCLKCTLAHLLKPSAHRPPTLY